MPAVVVALKLASYVAPWRLVIHVLGFDPEFLLAGFANPVMFTVDKGVVVDAFAVVVRAEIAFHKKCNSTSIAVRVSGRRRR